MGNTDSLQDGLLLLQCQQGDAASFEQLVQRWQQPLLNYAFRLTDNWAAAQDVVQDTWMIVIRNLVTLKDVACFRPWLFRIANHKCQDYWRRNQSSQRMAEELQNQPDDSALAAPPNAAQADMDQAFHRLPTESRMVLALMYLEDFTVSEIADMLDVPEGTIKSRLFHARQQLRQLMEKDYGSH